MKKVYTLEDVENICDLAIKAYKHAASLSHSVTPSASVLNNLLLVIDTHLHSPACALDNAELDHWRSVIQGWIARSTPAANIVQVLPLQPQPETVTTATHATTDYEKECAAVAARTSSRVRIDLSLFVNAADISAADVPHIVVEKLQRAMDATNASLVSATGQPK